MEVPCEPFSLFIIHSTFCFFFLTCSSFFFLFFLTWTWTWTYWHTGTLAHRFNWHTISLMVHYLASGAPGTNDSDARARHGHGQSAC